MEGRRWSFAEVAPDLLREALARGGQVRVPAAGSSMWPLLRGGDSLLVEAVDAGGVRPGDLVAFVRGGRLVIHRLMRRESGGTLHVRGDALREEERVSSADVLGRVALIETRFGRFDLHRPRDRAVARIVGLLGTLAPLRRAVTRLTGR